MITFKDFIREAAMKRSDPVISGEGPAVKLASAPVVRQSALNTRIENLAKKAKLDFRLVKKIWDETTQEVDPKATNRWAIITAKVKRKLNVID